VSEVNIALGKPAYMSSWHASNNMASSGNDGNHGTIFITNRGSLAWCAVDFGQERARVTRVRVTNILDERYRDRLLNFTIGLTDHDPAIDNGPLNYPFLKCATHGAMGDVRTVNLTCESPLYARRRYLFVAASVSDYFNLAEVEVFDDIDPSWLKMTGYRNDYNVSVLVDVNNATCQQVTTPHSDKSFRLEVELPTAHGHLTVTAVLDGGECLDFPATMVYTKSDQSAMLPYHNNPSFCDNEPGECVFECDCTAMQCQRVFLVILSAPTGPRKLCEIFIN
ncbi:hypothetical protein LSAT2_010604, partial [Lamellibrachia satsuma]